MTTHPPTDRQTAISEAITDRTLCDLLADTVREHADAPAYSSRAADGTWRTSTWGEVHEQVQRVAAGLVDLGVRPGDRVAVMASNRTEHVIADLGAVHAGAVPVTVYSTLAAEQLAYVADDSGAVVAFVEGTAELERWAAVHPRLAAGPRLVTIDPAEGDRPEGTLTWEELTARGDKRREEDPGELAGVIGAIDPKAATALLYTSGTTGEPKGVLLTHRNLLYQAERGIDAGLPPAFTHISYLPLAHIAERAWSIYIAVRFGAHVHFCPDPARLAETIEEVRPTMFFGVPRVWEKLQAAMLAALGAMRPEERAAVDRALEAGRAHTEAHQYGREVTPEIEAAWKRAEPVVLRLRAAIGLERLEWSGSAAAPLPERVGRFFAGLGLRIMDMYGMSETTGPVASNHPGAFRIGSVGPAVVGAELRLADDGEILARGPMVMKGYLGRPEATAETVDEDGWVHTGDVGRLDEDGFLYVVDRKKELIITSSGKNIAPSAVENALKAHPLIGQAVAYGDNRPYVVAVVVPDPEAAAAWAAARGLTADPAGLAGNEEFRAEIAAGVEEANSTLSRAEQVKYHEILTEPWEPGGPMVTLTLKLRRGNVYRAYEDLFAGMYR